MFSSLLCELMASVKAGSDAPRGFFGRSASLRPRPAGGRGSVRDVRDLHSSQKRRRVVAGRQALTAIAGSSDAVPALLSAIISSRDSLRWRLSVGGFMSPEVLDSGQGAGAILLSAAKSRIGGRRTPWLASLILQGETWGNLKKKGLSTSKSTYARAKKLAKTGVRAIVSELEKPLSPPPAQPKFPASSFEDFILRQHSITPSSEPRTSGDIIYHRTATKRVYIDMFLEQCRMAAETEGSDLKPPAVSTLYRHFPRNVRRPKRRTDLCCYCVEGDLMRKRADFLEGASGSGLSGELRQKELIDLRVKLSRVDSHRDAAQKQRTAMQQTIEASVSDPTSCVIILDFKENMRVGEAWRQVNREFFQADQVAVLGFVVHRAGVTHYFAVMSDVLSKDSKFVGDAYDLLIRSRPDVFLGVSSVNIWSDNGRHFRNSEVLYKEIVELPHILAGAKVSRHYLVEGHGKSSCDAFFGTISRIYSEALESAPEADVSGVCCPVRSSRPTDAASLAAFLEAACRRKKSNTPSSTFSFLIYTLAPSVDAKTERKCFKSDPNLSLSSYRSLTLANSSSPLTPPPCKRRRTTATTSTESSTYLYSFAERAAAARSALPLSVNLHAKLFSVDDNIVNLSCHAVPVAVVDRCVKTSHSEIRPLPVTCITNRFCSRYSAHSSSSATAVSSSSSSSSCPTPSSTNISSLVSSSSTSAAAATTLVVPITSTSTSTSITISSSSSSYSSRPIPSSSNASSSTAASSSSPLPRPRLHRRSAWATPLRSGLNTDAMPVRAVPMELD